MCGVPYAGEGRWKSCSGTDLRGWSALPHRERRWAGSVVVRPDVFVGRDGRGADEGTNRGVREHYTRSIRSPVLHRSHLHPDYSDRKSRGSQAAERGDAVGILPGHD